MPTNNTEKMGFSVSMGQEKREPCNLRTITLERVYKFIENKNIDAKLTFQLKKMAAVYPQQALENWMKNFNIHLLKARSLVKLSKPEISPVELGDEPKIPSREEIDHVPQNEEFE